MKELRVTRRPLLSDSMCKSWSFHSRWYSTTPLQNFHFVLMVQAAIVRYNRKFKPLGSYIKICYYPFGPLYKMKLFHITIMEKVVVLK